MKEAWPSATAELQGSDVRFDKNGTIVEVRYSAKRRLDAPGEQVLTNVLSARLAAENVRVVLAYERTAVRAKR